MAFSFENQLVRYADLAIRIGLDLQPGQKLVVSAPTDAAPFVRRLVAKAYEAGAVLVDVVWSDDGVTLARYAHAPAGSFEHFPTWRADALMTMAHEGGAALFVSGPNPDLLDGQDPVAVATVQRATAKHMEAFSKARGRQQVNWCIVAAAREGWAAKVFADRPVDDAVTDLWRAIFEAVRLDHDDPLAAWRDHLRSLARARDHLDTRRYDALRFRAPAHDGGRGTDLEVGLPADHRWLDAGLETEHGVRYVANLPTEEVFTSPHSARVDGTVSASKPLSHGGRLVHDFGFRFEAGRVVEVWAREGKEVLEKLLDTDEGARRLGELALVPASSPIARSGLLFFNTLFDENAASHLALGRGFPFALDGWQERSDEAVTDAGINDSLVHVDFMIGSPHMDVDGVRPDGEAEPIMRGGEWAF